MKKLYPIRYLANWFYGNYCARKCYNDMARQREHYPKLQELAKRLEGTQMSRTEFLGMLRSDKTICDLSDTEWKQRRFSWRRTDCKTCKAFGIR